MNYLAIDIGGTEIKYAVMDESAEFILKDRMPNRMRSVDDFLDVVETLWKKYGEDAHGIAFSMPGRIDNKTGYMYTSGNLGFLDNTDAAGLVRSRIPVDVSIENDAKAAAWAEIWKGELRGVDDAVVVVIGTGIGGAIVKDGRVHRGKNHSAGEFSFIYTGDPGMPYSGRDTFAGRCGIGGFLNPIAKAKGMPPQELDGFMAFQLLEQGDEQVLKVFESYLWELCRQLENLQFIYDPELILIGGGISRQPAFLEMLKTSLDRYHTEHRSPMAKPKLANCRFYNDANLVGAVYNFKQVVEGRLE